MEALCDILLVILTDILSRTVSKLSQIIVNILGTLRFGAPFGGLGATYTVRLRLIGKIVVDYLELFLGVTAEALRTNIDRKSEFFKRIGQFRPNFFT